MSNESGRRVAFFFRKAAMRDTFDGARIGELR
jgi:hypothetical protein